MKSSIVRFKREGNIDGNSKSYKASSDREQSNKYQYLSETAISNETCLFNSFETNPTITS